MATVYSVYANPLTAATTAVGYLSDSAGFSAARKRSVANGADYSYEFFHWSDLMPTTGTRNWTRFDAWVADTSLPLILHVAPLDGGTKFYPSDIVNTTALNNATVTNALTTLMNDIAARVTASRITVVLLGNEIDSYLSGSPAARVTECSGYLGTMKTATQTALGASTKVAMSFRYFCVKDGTFASNSYATVSNAGSYPVFTYYPINSSTFVCYDFLAGTGGMGDDFTAMTIATGGPLAFGLQEMGCPSHPSLTNNIGGNGEATQQAFYVAACGTVLPTFASVLNFVTFAWMTDWPAAVVTDAGYTNAIGQYIGSIGAISPSGHPKAGYDEVVGFLAGRDNALIRPSRYATSYATGDVGHSFY